LIRYSRRIPLKIKSMSTVFVSWYWDASMATTQQFWPMDRQEVNKYLCRWQNVHNGNSSINTIG